MSSLQANLQSRRRVMVQKPLCSIGTARIESNDTTMIISDGALRMDRNEAKHSKSSRSILVVDYSLTEGVEMVYESSTHILTKF